MIIGIVGPAGTGKGVAADFLARNIPEANVRSLADNPKLLDGKIESDGVTIIPDVCLEVHAARIRRSGGRIVFMYGRTPAQGGRHPGSIDVGIDGKDYLVSNSGGFPELYSALSEVAAAVSS